MTTATSQDFIDVQSVRLGMFVHLDLGWMAHPFPLSSFKVTTPDQLATLRTLGLQRVRWSPQQSDAETAGALLPRALAAAKAVPNSDSPDAPAADAEAAPSGVPAAPAQPEASAQELHRRKLEAQRTALQLCERQFAEAARECRQLTDLVPVRPQQARAQAEALCRALMEKMLAEEEVCIRLLTDAAGDKASAHALNVTIISLLMGRSFGLSEGEMQDLGVGALLHDIGKIELPERMRHFEARFNAAEARCYEEHVARGLALARTMGLAPGAALVLGQHHEHADGSGFPARLNADGMTPAARILSLVNRYDNLCNPFMPGQAVTPHESLSLIFAQGKAKFDTTILAGFIKMMGVYPPGSTVQLTDDRFAMVTAVNSSRPLKPRVLVHEPRVPRSEALLLDLEKAAGLGIRRSIRPQALPPDALAYLSPRKRVAYFFEPAHGGVVPA